MFKFNQLGRADEKKFPHRCFRIKLSGKNLPTSLPWRHTSCYTHALLYLSSHAKAHLRARCSVRKSMEAPSRQYFEYATLSSYLQIYVCPSKTLFLHTYLQIPTSAVRSTTFRIANRFPTFYYV